MKPPLGRILIVDDDLASQTQARAALEHLGFQCDVAEDGDAAVMMIARHRYDAVVTELILPKLNGGELVINLCARENAPIVIVCTRVLQQEVYFGLKNEGVDAIFYKPSDYEAMAEVVLTYVKRRRQLQAQWTGAMDNRVVKAFCKGDNWIEKSTFRIEAFRMMIIFLACVLLGMGWGNSLDDATANLCKMFGLSGLAFFFCLELVAYQRMQNRDRMLQWSAELGRAPHVKSTNSEAVSMSQSA